MTDTAPQPGPPQLRAGLAIRVYAIGRPGYIKIVTGNTGPGRFTRREAARILRVAARQLDAGTGWLGGQSR